MITISASNYTKDSQNNLFLNSIQHNGANISNFLVSGCLINWVKQSRPRNRLIIIVEFLIFTALKSRWKFHQNTKKIQPRSEKKPRIVLETLILNAPTQTVKWVFMWEF